MDGRKILIALFLLLSAGLQAQQSKEKTMDKVIAPYQYPVQYHSVDDSTHMAYIDEGKGPKTLVFIHGLATYLPSWYPTIDALKTEYRCIAIDMPGYGRSTKGDYPATMTYYAGMINEFISSLKLQNVVLVGHSMGAQVAMTTLLKNPSAYEELIMLAPAGFETFQEAQKNWLKAVFTTESVFSTSDEQIRANWKLNFFDMPSSVEFMIEDRLAMKKSADFRAYCQSVARGVEGMLNEPVFDQLKDISQRILVVYGVNDQLIPNRYLNPQLTTQAVAEAGVAQLPNAQLKFIENCGHFITFDQPDKINELLRVFLAK